MTFVIAGWVLWPHLSAFVHGGPIQPGTAAPRVFWHAHCHHRVLRCVRWPHRSGSGCLREGGAARGASRAHRYSGGVCGNGGNRRRRGCLELVAVHVDEAPRRNRAPPPVCQPVLALPRAVAHQCDGTPGGVHRILHVTHRHPPRLLVGGSRLQARPPRRALRHHRDGGAARAPTRWTASAGARRCPRWGLACRAVL